MQPGIYRHHDAGVERGFVTVTLPHCPMAREKRSLATVSSFLMDKIDYPSFICHC
jgi:hypothetical protein